MTPTLKDWMERRRAIREAFPDDLLEDLKDDEPELYAEAQDCDNNIIRLKKELNSSVSPIALLPSLLTEGWDHPRKHGKHTKNWPDMENILKLYAIGLYFRSTPLTQQAQWDKEELTQAIEKASLGSKRRCPIPAQKRIEKAPTYLRFGLQTLNAFFIQDTTTRQCALHDLDCEIEDAMNNNIFNGTKLRKSKNMALRVGKMIRDRYNSK